jgi:hypothetical protein
MVNSSKQVPTGVKISLFCIHRCSRIAPFRLPDDSWGRCTSALIENIPSQPFSADYSSF